MKLPFTIYDLRFAISKKSDRVVDPFTGESGVPGVTGAAGLASNRKSSIENRKSQEGIALIITLIMLAITLVMAVAFLALARRERGSVTTTTDTTTARLAAETAVASAQAQIVANIFNNPANAYNLRLLVSTNYINPLGFTPNSGNPTNVNYFYSGGGVLTPADFEQNVANLFLLPRAPVLISSNEPLGRFYMDLNENGHFEQNGVVTNYDNFGNAIYDASGSPTIFAQGDPEWVGVLEHPDAPHGPNNHFISRYAFIALPVGNSLDINYIHNQARNTSLTTSDGFMRNQGIGSWEINLAAFLADLNTNIWGQLTDPAGRYYEYNEPAGANNNGFAFEDARALVAYRYNYVPLPTAANLFFNALNTFPYDGMDNYSRGPLQTNLEYNRNIFLPAVNVSLPWSGADSTNHYFTLGDFFDPTKVSGGPTGGFTNRLRLAGSQVDTYDRYTYYRMLDQLGSDSTVDAGKLDLNYSNAVVGYYTNGPQVGLVGSVAIIPGAETNLVPWRPQDFFLAAADRLLRTYTASWFQAAPVSYLATYYGVPANAAYYYHLDNSGNISTNDPTGWGLTNIPFVGMTNQIPSFGITNIPVLVNGSFVYTPAVNRLLQLAANLYDATTMTNNNLPHVFRPTFWVTNEFYNGVSYKNVYINSYEDVSGYSQNNTLTAGSPPLDPPVSVAVLPVGIVSGLNVALRNVYGVPWIIGAKKGLPNFNQFYLVNAAQVTRKLEVKRSSTDPATATYTTNQMYIMGISNSLGVSFWNSYASNYVTRSGQGLTVYASDQVYMTLTNGSGATWPGYFYTNYIATFKIWPGSHWSGTPPYATPDPNSFLNVNWSFNFLNQSVYRFGVQAFVPVGSPGASGFETTTPSLTELPQFGLQMTNFIQAYILDGNNVIDYVQLSDPLSIWNLNPALADPFYPDETGTYYQWSTNFASSASLTPWGVMNQLTVSSGNVPPPVVGGQWSTSPTPMGLTTPPAEQAFFKGFFVPNFYYVGPNGGQNYVNSQLSIQAPYTPSRTAYTSFLLQANDPQVHYLASDLNSQTGAWAYWASKVKRQNGDYYHSDDSQTQPLPTYPANPIGGRYQPWLQNGQMDGLNNVIPVTNNYAVKDPLVEFSDNWDFPTNLYPTVGWIGRVHRGTPWQTVYLKDADMMYPSVNANGTTNYFGTNTWAQWTGDIQSYFGQYFDAANAAPAQDRLLFDIFTARLNDNATRGSLPVNQTHLAAWSALFSGIVAISNDLSMVFASTPLPNTDPNTYTYQIVNPAGVFSNTLPYKFWPPVAQIVNGPLGINTTRANTNLFQLQAFTHVGDILSVPALTGQSPLLHPGPTPAGFGQQQRNFGISDEEYEWLPQQMMGLVRLGDPRFVLYCYGQALSPAPGGTVLSGPFFQLVTNYQVTAESAVRAVVSVHPQVTATLNGFVTNYTTTVESYNVLPPN